MPLQPSAVKNQVMPFSRAYPSILMNPLTLWDCILLFLLQKQLTSHPSWINLYAFRSKNIQRVSDEPESVRHLQSSYSSKKSNCCSRHRLHRSLCYLGFTVMPSTQQLFEQWTPGDKFILLNAVEQEPCYSIFSPQNGILVLYWSSVGSIVML